MKSFSRIPIINIEPLIHYGPNINVLSVKECIYQIHYACRDVGFLGLMGHNISYELQQETLKVARQFFAMDLAEKEQIHISKYNNATGYQYFGENVTQNTRDQHEGIDLYRSSHNPNHSPINIPTPWPSKPETFKPIINEYIHEMNKFGKLIMESIALSLRLPYDYFHNKMDDPVWICRVLHYPLPNETNNINDSNELPFGIACGQHRGMFYNYNHNQ